MLRRCGQQSHLIVASGKVLGAPQRQGMPRAVCGADLPLGAPHEAADSGSPRRLSVIYLGVPPWA